MYRPFAIAAVGTFALTLFVGEGVQTAAAQGGSTTNWQMNRLGQQSVGIGYTIDSINNRTISSSIARPVITGVPSVDRSAGAFGSPRAPSLGLNNSRPTSRPFSNLQRRPSVSPYLLLDNDSSLDPNQSSTNYQTLVRPQIEQQRRNQQVQSEMQAINARLQSMAAQPSQNPAGSQSLAPTGSPSTFRYYSHFYPGKGR